MTPATRLQEMRRDVEGRQNRYWDEEQKRCSGKNVVLVEGDDDRTAVEAMLTATDPTWSTRAAVVVAGRRDGVVKRLHANSTFPAGVGLVDRDVWTDPEVATHTASGRLFVTAGWCIENSLLIERLPNDPATLDADLERVRDAWVRVGALWWTLQRTREAFNAWQDALGWRYGSLHPGLDLTSSATLVTSLETRIDARLRDAVRLDPGEIGAAWQLRLDEVLAWPAADQWLRGVRGKSAFAAVVVPLLNAAHPPRSAREWLVARAGALRHRPPFDAILSRVL